MLGVLLCVCGYVWNLVLKPQNVYSALIQFFSLFSGIGQNWVKLLIFFQIHFASFLLMSFTIVVIINKAFKLFKLVLVVYCISCWQWWHPVNSGSLKNACKAKNLTGTLYRVYIPVAFIAFIMLETVTDCSNSHYSHYLRFLTTKVVCTANAQCIFM